MKGKFFFLFLLLIFSGISFSRTYAQSEGDVLVQGSFLNVILNLVILLAVCVCLFYTKRIESFLKGGELFLGWFLIFISFFILVFLQFVNLGNAMNVFKFDPALYTFFKLVWVILLGWGIYRLKKVIS